MSPFPTPCKGKSKSQTFAHTFALTGRRRLCTDTQGVALGSELAALSGRSRRRLQGIAPERGSYSRIGACPYLPPVLSNSRCCPCKGRISWAGLAPQQDSRYEPLTGARFINRPQEVGASPYPKYEPLSGAVLSPQPSRPSLCEQSELQCYRPNPRAPHFASKVSYNAAPQKALQCYRPQKRYNAAPQSASLPISHTYFPISSYKSSFCGRDSCDLRPRVALPSAASRATRGCESMTSQ